MIIWMEKMAHNLTKPLNTLSYRKPFKQAVHKNMDKTKTNLLNKESIQYFIEFVSRNRILTFNFWMVKYFTKSVISLLKEANEADEKRK